MKRRIVLSLALVLIIFMFLSCNIVVIESEQNTVIEEQNIEYGIEELQSFFSGSSVNESMGVDTDTKLITFGEVKRQFPDGLTREEGYTVYRVDQGGCFYVFWSEPFEGDEYETEDEAIVYFSTYLASDRELEEFKDIQPGVSTAQDVKAIDPSFELSFLRSNGDFSYSYIDNNTVLQIEYEMRANVNDYSDLVVKELKVVSRDSAPARLSSIQSEDLP